MAALAIEERVEQVEDKVDRLEVLFGHFMTQTGTTIARLDRTIARLDQTVVEMKAEGAADRQRIDAALANAAADRQRMDENLAAMKAEATADRQRMDENLAAMKAEAAADRQRMDENLTAMKAEGVADRQRIDAALANAAADRQRMDENLAAMKAEAAADRRRMDKKWGELSHRLGTLAEDLVAPNIPRIATEYFGWSQVDDLMVRRFVRHKQDRSKRREFDVIAVGEGQVIVNETKLTPKVDGIDDFRETLDEFVGYLPEYEGFKIIPIFAALYLRDDLVAYLTRQGIYAMAMADDTMELLNFDALT